MFYLEMTPRLRKRTPVKFRQVWASLGMPGHIQPKVVVLHATFSW